ncbi:MAG: hypothetical protein HGB19_05300 [Chlorobiales bacterium]|nr:hypothetical protein [Chlorobiales bacterium]
MILTAAAIQLLQQGNIIEARKRFSDILKTSSPDNMDALDEARLGLAITCLYMNNLPECETELNNCLTIFRQKHSGIPLLSTLQALIEYHLETETYSPAFTLIDEAFAILSRAPSPLMETAFHLYRIILLCREKLPHKARELLTNIEQQKAEELYFNLTDGLYETKAELALAEGDQSGAQFFFEEAAGHANKYNPFLEMMYLHRAATACQTCGPKSRLLHERSLELARKLHLDKRAELFQKKFNSQSVPQPIKQVLVTPPPIPVIKIFGLGQFAVFHPGESAPITKHDWRSEKARKLLLYLLLKEPHQRTKTLIADAVWRDADDARKQSNLFHTTLSQLRKTLNDPGFIYNEDSIYSVRIDRCWTDWGEFERHTQTGLDAERKGDVPLAMSSFKKAKDLYIGEFASGLDDDWLLDKRQSLWSKHEHVINHLSGLMEEEGDLEQALILIEEWIRLMPENDLPYQTAIRLAARLGDNAKATRYYEACCNMLRDEYGLSPSKALKETYSKYVFNS